MKFKPKESNFETKEKYEDYREKARCGVCHKRLEIGEEFELRPIQTPEETGSLTVQAVIVHKKCIG